MENLRKPSEVILSKGRNLEEVLELHMKWLNDEEGGKRADLSCEDLSYVNLKGVNLNYAILSYTNLSGANLYKSNLSYVDLNEVNLTGVYLSGADLSYSNLSYSNLSYSDLSNANLYNADLSNANLYNADLSNANLSNTKFYLTNLYKAEGDFVGVENIGSRNDTTHYFYKDNRVICGCFSGTMKEFEERVKESYDKYDKEYRQYMFAIDVLKRFAEIELEEKKIICR